MVRLGLAAVFDPRQWCQDDTKGVPMGLVVPQEHDTHPEPATGILVLTPPPDVLCSADGSSQLC